jgi:hypothetical protein
MKPSSTDDHLFQDVIFVLHGAAVIKLKSHLRLLFGEFKFLPEKKDNE